MFYVAHPRHSGRQVALMLLCKGSGLQPLNGHYKKGLEAFHWPPPLCVTWSTDTRLPLPLKVLPSGQVVLGSDGVLPYMRDRPTGEFNDWRRS